MRFKEYLEEKKVPKEFMNDPLYKKVLTAKDEKSFKKALETLLSIRGSGAVDALKYAMKNMKESDEVMNHFLNEKGFKCRDCGKKMNPAEAMLSMKHGVCGKCTRKKHKEATKR